MFSVILLAMFSTVCAVVNAHGQTDSHIQAMKDRMERELGKHAQEIAAEYGNIDYLLIIPSSVEMQNQFMEYAPAISDGMQIDELLKEKRSQLAELEKSFVAMQSKLTAMETQLGTKKEELASVVETIASKSSQIANLDGEILQLQKRSQEQKATLADQDRLIAQREQELQSIGKQFADIHSILGQLSTVVARVGDEISNTLIAQDEMGNTPASPAKEQVASNLKAEKEPDAVKQSAPQVITILGNRNAARHLAQTTLASETLAAN